MRVSVGGVVVHVADGLSDMVVVIADGELGDVTAPSCEACAVLTRPACRLQSLVLAN
jgi:hypothetical protein